jgi:hypothetical protein
LKLKLSKGNILLTTHRVIFYKENQGVELPLHYIKAIEKTVSEQTED